MKPLKKLLTFKIWSEDPSALMVNMLRSIFDQFDGHLQIQLWDGQRVNLGMQAAPVNGSPFVLIFHTPAILETFLKRKDPLTFAESYFKCEMDIEGDLAALLALREQFNRLHFDWRLKGRALIDQLIKQVRQPVSFRPFQLTHLAAAKEVLTHSRNESKQSIQFHYDVSNEFYALWLDPRMVYSCAYFLTETQELASAQTAKLDLICRKLQLTRGYAFLDVGCGWGALILHAARYYGVKAHGVTLSSQQYDYAQQQIRKAGLVGRVSVELQDYRDIPGQAQYNKIASVGMFEHVGIKNLAAYFQTIRHLLARDGLFLNHGITSDTKGWPNNLGHTFVNRYVFPDGQLETISHIQTLMELAEFEIIDVQSMRRHYVLTLKSWISQLVNQHEHALKHVSEATFRIWLSYMTASRLSFENGHLGLYQILVGHRTSDHMKQPLTRDYMSVKSPTRPAILQF
jgi:cyclopropane-fatty-acyl-phospholipid synthase